MIICIHSIQMGRLILITLNLYEISITYNNYNWSEVNFIVQMPDVLDCTKMYL